MYTGRFIIDRGGGTVAWLALLVLIRKKNVILASAVLFVPLSLLGWLFSLPAPLIIYSMALPCLVGITHFLRTRPAVRQAEPPAD